MSEDNQTTGPDADPAVQPNVDNGAPEPGAPISEEPAEEASIGTEQGKPVEAPEAPVTEVQAGQDAPADTQAAPEAEVPGAEDKSGTPDTK